MILGVPSRREATPAAQPQDLQRSQTLPRASVGRWQAAVGPVEPGDVQ